MSDDSAVEAARQDTPQPETAAEVDARWRRYCVAEVMIRNPQVNDFVGDKEREIKCLRGPLDKARSISAAMAEDDGLWFIAQTASEAYLQQELRRLCAAIEAEFAACQKGEPTPAEGQAMTCSAAEAATRIVEEYNDAVAALGEWGEGSEEYSNAKAELDWSLENLGPTVARALLSSQSQVERMREALEKISAEQWKDRSTVSELNAWPAFQRLNRHVVELYAIADAALTTKEEK